MYVRTLTLVPHTSCDVIHNCNETVGTCTHHMQCSCGNGQNVLNWHCSCYVCKQSGHLPLTH